MGVGVRAGETTAGGGSDSPPPGQALAFPAEQLFSHELLLLLGAGAWAWAWAWAGAGAGPKAGAEGGEGGPTSGWVTNGDGATTQVAAGTLAGRADVAAVWPGSKSM